MCAGRSASGTMPQKLDAASTAAVPVLMKRDATIRTKLEALTLKLPSSAVLLTPTSKLWKRQRMTIFVSPPLTASAVPLPAPRNCTSFSVMPYVERMDMSGIDESAVSLLDTTDWLIKNSPPLNVQRLQQLLEDIDSTQ